MPAAAATLLVPMTLVSRQYFDEIIGTLREAGEEVLHVFLDLPADVLESRIQAQVVCPDDPERDEIARQFRLKNIGRCVAAAKEQREDTIMLRTKTCWTHRSSRTRCSQPPGD